MREGYLKPGPELTARLDKARTEYMDAIAEYGGLVMTGIPSIVVSEENGLTVRLTLAISGLLTAEMAHHAGQPLGVMPKIYSGMVKGLAGGVANSVATMPPELRVALIGHVIETLEVLRRDARNEGRRH